MLGKDVVPAKLSVALVILALLSACIEQPELADRRGWAQPAPAALSGVASPAQVAGCPATPDFSFSVPDPSDDSFGLGSVRHEIINVSGEGDTTTFCLTVDFAGAVVPPNGGSADGGNGADGGSADGGTADAGIAADGGSVDGGPADAGIGRELVGFVEFDTDADATTGRNNVDGNCPARTGIGGEAFLDMFTVSGGTGLIVDRRTSTATPVPVTFNGTSFTAVIPLSAIGGDSSFNLAMVLGTIAGPTDCAPDGASIHSPDGAIVPPPPTLPPPANDNFANATSIASLPFTDILSNGGATTEPGEPSPPCAPVVSTVWYSFTPPADMLIAADTLGSNFNTVLTAFTGSDFASLQPVGCQAFGNRLVLNLRAGTTYYFQVGGFFSETGNLVFNVAPFVGPENDNFANATSIGSLPFTGSLSTDGATTEPGEPSPSCAPGGSTVWYSFTPAADMSIAADTLGSNFNTVLSVFTGSDFATLQPVGCQVGNRLFLNLTAGTTYYFQVGGFSGETGNLVFNVAPLVGPLPENDNFANATIIASLPFTDSLSTVGATTQPGEPSPPCAPGGGTVWYSFTPAADVSIAVDTLGSNFNTVLTAFTGSDFATLQPVVCQPFNRLFLNLAAGATYYFQVAGYDGQAGDLVFNVAPFVGPRPENDNFANATLIASLPFTDSLSTEGATTEPDEPSPNCAPVGSTVWYSFTPAVDADIEANTVGSNYDTTLSVYTGARGALTQIACNDDFFDRRSRVLVQLSAGTTYYFQVGGFFGETGNLVFNVAPFLGPENDDFANATLIASLPFTDSLSTQGATTEPGEPPSPCAPVGGTVWYAFTPAADVSIVADTLGSNFDTVLTAFTGTDFATLQPIGCEAFGLGLGLDLRAGTTYYFQVGGLSGQAGNLVVNVAALVPPENDNFANATSIASLPFTGSLSTQEATTEPGEPSPPCAPVGSTVWYSFTPAADTSIAADTLGSDFPTVLAAFTGSDFATLQPVGCQAFGNRLILGLRAGTTYYFQVGGFSGQTGNLVFNVAAVVRPANDDFADATIIASLPFTDSLSTQGATTEPDEPSPNCVPARSTVWYSFTPAVDANLAANTVGSNYDTTLSVYTGARGALTQIACNDDFFGLQSRVLVHVSAGTTYYFQVGGFSGQTGNLVFNVAAEARPANDNFANATRIASLPFTGSLSTQGATTEPGEPLAPCAPVGSTVWYSFTPAADMSIAADTLGSNFNTVLTAFTGSDFATLQSIGCQPFGNRLVLDLRAGTTYHFQIGGFSGQTGNLVFNVAVFVRLGVSLSIDPTGSVLPSTGAATVSGFVTCNKPAFVDLSGSLRQRAGRGFITGVFSLSLQCDGATRWSATVASDSGPFAGGSADVLLSAFASNTEGESASAQASATVRLQGTTPR
jgi:hypothetical protein